MKGLVKQKWGELTDDELEQLRGRRDQLAGLIEQKYGLAKEGTGRQIKEFEASCKC